MLKKKQVFYLDHSLKARYGVFPRYASSEKEIKWFDLPAHYVFHYMNAWEEIND